LLPFPPPSDVAPGIENLPGDVGIAILECLGIGAAKAHEEVAKRSIAEVVVWRSGNAEGLERGAGGSNGLIDRFINRSEQTLVCLMHLVYCHRHEPLPRISSLR
jgi:hypothetical protein